MLLRLGNRLSLPSSARGVILNSDMRTYGLVDSHLHLQDFPDGTDVRALVEQASAAGVTHLICNSTSEADWHEVLGYAGDQAQIMPCLGIHPWFVPGRSERWASVLEDLVRAHRCGVGEIGLDRNREPFDKAAQEEVFLAQLDIARRHHRPAMVHCVRSWGWMMDVLRSEASLPCGMLMHSYGGSADLVRELGGMGAYFSFSGKVLEPNYERARKALLAVPPDRLLIETDGPCMIPPAQYRAYEMSGPDGEALNHPANLPLILRGIADLLGESPGDLQARLWENARRFFAPIMDLESSETER